MASESTPLDEIQWELPAAVAYYGGIRADNVHLYFLNSPFCDQTSNNKVLELQAARNNAMHPMLQDRTRFEEQLRSLRGVEYVVADGPKVNSETMNPVWTIRKQRRQKTQGEPDTLTTLGTYYVMGSRIYQAPSVADILAAKLGHTAQLMQQFFQKASDMQFFSPSTGYSYTPPVQKISKVADLGSTTTSRAATPAPLASQVAQSQSSAKIKDDAAMPASQRDEQDLMASLKATIDFNDEFMDENELVGEPGNFTFKATQAHLRSQAEKTKAVTLREKERQAAKSLNGSTAPSPLPSLKTDGLNALGKKPASAGKSISPVSAGANPMKPKRRKSQAISLVKATSPS